MRVIAIGICMGIWLPKAQADSPLSSCYFAPAYREIPEIASMMALEAGTDEDLLMDAFTSVFLLDDDRPLDHRMALINALGFGQRTNVDLIVQYVAIKYGAPTAEWQAEVLDSNWVSLSRRCKKAGVLPQDFLVIAYAAAMADYTNPRCALPFLSLAKSAMPNNETVAWIAQLIMGQMVMEQDLCEVYVMFAELQNGPFVEGMLREEAKRRIMDYIGLYEEACLPDPFSEEYYRRFPVYDTLQAHQKANAAKYVDLHFVGALEGVLALEDHVNGKGEEGCKVVVEIRNSGNTINIPTNLYCELYILHESREERLIRQVAIPPIKANQSDIVSIHLPGIWWNGSSGRMILTIDQAAQIDERNEANNSAIMGQ